MNTPNVAVACFGRSPSNIYAMDGAYPGHYRCIHIPPVLLPPVIFTGLLVALWVWKCMMLVVFQNKIIYMPGLPPNARKERIEDYAGLCGGIQWREERTLTADGKDIAMAVATVPLLSSPATAKEEKRDASAVHVYILYFQGNASSIPPRLPDLSWVLRGVSEGSKPMLLPPSRLTFVCLSYRGYWTSRGRPSEKGIQFDAEAGVRWITEEHRSTYGCNAGRPVPVLLLWGQSIGSGVATNLAATGIVSPDLPIRGLILETPFLSVRAMLTALYPQKWLPYKHLWPFLRNHLDSMTNLSLIDERSKKEGGATPEIFILEAGRDELVPKEHGELLFQSCLDLGLPVEKNTVPAAYHSEAIARGDGKKLAAHAILQLTKRALDKHKG
ncbi:hypothetical protein B0H67DRAFT_597188 [Lasiosphaeris hirsuta]|uniref:Uncharacterized protein n=1 Tax=Lasiosphaeris hirsuta TaxID=260670 RepID=A0AA40BBP2_9PEZI|nr:hypothetical protein B0H67DRAFT_597188 [Lasiosphaeris hirsuta]